MKVCVYYILGASFQFHFTLSQWYRPCKKDDNPGDSLARPQHQPTEPLAALPSASPSFAPSEGAGLAGEAAAARCAASAEPPRQMHPWASSSLSGWEERSRRLSML